MTVEFTRNELEILSNALNEVCNGIHLEGEFDTRMGCSVEEARTLLAKIQALATGIARDGSPYSKQPQVKE